MTAKLGPGSSPKRTKAGEPVPWCNHATRATGGPHVHGTNAAYGYCRCRCQVCRDDHAQVNNQRTRAHLYGRYDRLVPAEPIRAHVRALSEQGIGRRRLCELAGIHASNISNLMLGKKDRPVPERISKETAEKILAVPLPGASVELHAGGTRTSAIGTQRRLQALIAAGWSQTEITRRLGCQMGAINDMLWLRIRKSVTAGTARSVHQLYLQLHETPPPPGRGSSRARNMAAKHGWVGPDGWWDLDIDDPAAVPYRPEDDVDVVDLDLVDDAVAGRPLLVPLSEPDKVEAIAQLARLGTGEGKRTLAARFSFDPTATERILVAARQGRKYHLTPVVYHRDGQPVPTEDDVADVVA